MYNFTDKVVATLNRKYIALFNKLKYLPKDERLIVKRVKETYDEIEEMTEQYFLLIAKKVYKRMAEILECDDFDTVTDLWLLKILNDYDPITKYVYLHEVDRKRARLAEALVASDDKPSEVESAKKIWFRQAKQYADIVTDKAVMQVYIDNEIREVVWETEKDEKVCSKCRPRDGMRYFTDEVPPKPHYGCRCTIRPIEAEDLLWNKGYSL